MFSLKTTHKNRSRIPIFGQTQSNLLSIIRDAIQANLEAKVGLDSIFHTSWIILFQPHRLALALGDHQEHGYHA